MAREERWEAAMDDKDAPVVTAWARLRRIAATPILLGALAGLALCGLPSGAARTPALRLM